MTRVEKSILIILLIVASLLPPILFYFYSHIPTVSPGKAAELLKEKPKSTLLLDVRKKREFELIHVYSSLNISAEALLNKKISNDQMAVFQGKTVLILCESGLHSIAVTRKLRNNHINAFNIEGGLHAWIAHMGKPSAGLTSLITSPEEKEFLFYRVAPSHEQWLAVLTGYGIKPLYTILSFILIILLWKKDEIELVALKYSMIFFFLGENFCAVNYLFFKHESYLFEYLHSLGMVICFGFVTYALFHGVDKYVIHYSDQSKKCAFLGLCAQCFKYEAVSCVLIKIFIFISLATSVISLMPLFAELKMISYNTEIWRTLYNYSHPVIYQIFEVRYCPIIAGLAFASAGLILLTKKDDPLPLAKIVFAAGCGSAGFSFFRFILFHGYQDNLVWMEFWEEITEFIFIGGVAFLLWQFRGTLFGRT